MGISRHAAWLAGLTFVACWACAGGARGQHARLATSPGDGSVAFQLDAYGAFGYRSFGGGAGGTGDAIYDPVGSVGPSSTSWQSAVYMRMPPRSTFLTIGSVGQAAPSGGLPDPGFTYQDGTTAVSSFSHAGLDWQLTQSVEDLVVGPDRLGTMLVQEYLITNAGAATVTFDLVRYYEGDLYLGLGAGVPDGGGRLLVGPEELLFQTDRAGEPAATTNLVGITACGGTAPARGRYEVNAWSAFPNRITADQPLGDVIYQDGADPDQFVDAGLDYDVGIALANQFSLAPGEIALYVTTTVFGSLPPAGVSGGCAVRAQAVAAAGPDQAACPGKTIALDGSTSFDPDSVPGGLPETWSWDLDVAADSSGNAIPDDDVDATGPVVSAIFPLGVTVVQLTYTDDDGDTDTDQLIVTIADASPPRLDCPAAVTVPATSFAGAFAEPVASAADDCVASPGISNDRTTGGASAADDYPCGRTEVTFSTADDGGNVTTCVTLVDVVGPVVDFPVGAALRVFKDAAELPILDWSRVGPYPPEVRFSVLREETRRAPTSMVPGARFVDAWTWTDSDPTGPLVFYDVRSALCDGTLSPD